MLNASVTADWGGSPLAELSRLIGRRAVQLQEGAAHALYATARHLLRSLKPQMKVARVGRGELAFDFEDTGLVIGKYKGAYRPHSRFRNDYRMDIRPIALWGGGYPEHTVHVYKVTPRFGGRMTWKMNMHKGCWYIAAYTEAVARRHARRLMRRAVLKYRGLARASVVAMHMAARRAFSEGDREAVSYGGVPRNVADAANRMASASFRRVAGASELTVTDDLSYATDALKNGAASISLAVMKASNSVAGYLRKRTGDLLDPSLATPFPDIARI